MKVWYQEEDLNVYAFLPYVLVHYLNKEMMLYSGWFVRIRVKGHFPLSRPVLYACKVLV